MAMTLRHKAMDLLARREYSRRELGERLHRSFPDVEADEIQGTIERLADEGLQSDQRFAEGYIRLRVSRGQGPRKIQFELMQRGVGDDLAGPLMAQYDWPELASEVAARKFGSTPPVDDREKAKRLRFMNQRGFDWEHIDFQQ